MVKSLKQTLYHGLEGNLWNCLNFTEINPEVIDVKI